MHVFPDRASRLGRLNAGGPRPSDYDNLRVSFLSHAGLTGMKLNFISLYLTAAVLVLAATSAAAQQGDEAAAEASPQAPAESSGTPPSPSDRESGEGAGGRPSDSADRGRMANQRRLSGNERDLWFNFSQAQWKTVLEWFADEAELSLEYDQLPFGTFTYSDPTRAYSVSEALDVINLGLMKRGYALARRGRSLQIIDLEMENADKLISEIAELVKPSELDERGDSDIVSCVFPLGSMSPEAAKEELAQMVGPWGRVIVLDSARQVKVTETSSKLRAIRTLLENATSAESQVVEMELEHRTAEELLELARPLLGLEPGENVSEDIRISVSLYGDLIMATGDPGKLSLLEAIVTKRDKPLPTVEGDGESDAALPVFKTHFVATADIATVFDVLQTMLADTPDTRIGLDPNTKAVIARARPETQELIAKTIAEMEGKGQDFKVIQLRRLEPSQALLTINKFFGITEEAAADGPTVDGDPVTGRLWVRGTPEQIELVEKLINELEGDDGISGLDDRVRILPYTGRAAEEALQQVQSLWQVTGRQNTIRTRTPSRNGSAGRGIPERRANREPDARSTPTNTRPSPAGDDGARMPGAARLPQPLRSPPAGEVTQIPEANLSADSPPATRLVIQNDASSSDNDDGASDGDNGGGADQATAAERRMSRTGSERSEQAGSGGDILVELTPAGIVIASEDVEALNAFEALFQSFASPSAMQTDLPTIFWLKYAEADATAELVLSVLGGGESTISSAVDTVTGGGFSGMLGLLGGGGGGGSSSSSRSVLTSTGSVSIIPDMRLNALIVQANPVDLQMIELILEKVDRQESPEDIETTAKPALIPVIYQDADDVATVVKSVFGDRIVGNESGGGGRGGRGGGGDGPPSPQDFINALRGGGGRGGRGGGDTPTFEAPKISIAVDAKSNSLVVIATPQDFEEVRSLVSALDYGGKENEEVVVTVPVGGGLNTNVLVTALESILGTQVTATSSSDSSSSTASSNNDNSNNGGASEADVQRRQEFFNRLRSGGFGGRPGGFGGFGGRGGGFGGFGGRGGGFGGRGGGGDGGGDGGRGGGDR